VLREAIGVGRVVPGDRLVEKNIAAELGTSRAPVREALRELVHEGLVTHAPYRGTFVLGLSEEEVHAVLIPIRLALERYGFAQALPGLGERELGELKRIVDGMEDAAGTGDLRRVVEADVLFHDFVLALSGLPHTTQIWRSITPRMRVYFYRYDKDRDLRAVVDEHRQLYEALASGDRTAIETLLHEHIVVPPPRPESDRWPG
jgi:DNA-binding GntR family transcriptional regulator